MAGVFYKLATAPVIAVVAYRMLLATALMLPLLWISRGNKSEQRGAVFGASDVLATALSGAIFGALFLRERPTGLMILGMAVAACGAVIITTGDVRVSGQALIGDALALCAALAETGYLLLGRHVRQRVDTLRYATVVYAACALCVWVGLGLSHTSPLISTHDLLVCFGLALVVTVFGHTLVSRSLGHMPAVVVAVAFLSQPIMTAAFAWLLLHQAIPVLTALGGSIALAGIGIVAYANERSVAEGPPAGI